MTDWHQEARPYTKAMQLGPPRSKRYRRKVASAKQWAAIRAEKCGWCRVCYMAEHALIIDPHHLIPRDRAGDDLADNIVGLCRACHDQVERREPTFCRSLLSRLSDAEYAYAVQRAGEDFAERIYRIVYTRASAVEKGDSTDGR